MEFSYRMDAEAYWRGYKLMCRRNKVRWIAGVALLWIVFALAIMGVWATASEISAQHDPRPTPTFFTLPGALFLSAIAIGYSTFYSTQKQVQRRYRGDPAQQGTIRVHVTSDAFEIGSDVGFISRSEWKLFDFWRMKESTLILAFHSGQFYVLNLMELSEAQRETLRSTLSGVAREL